jgi:uncharacterized protein (DUF1015 family)
MAEIRPLRAVRYEPDAVGSLDAVAAPPYDVIDDEMRAALVRKSPFNVVEIDLPIAEDGGDPYLHAQTTYEHWLQQGILVREREDSVWALTQTYEGPDGNGYTRHGFFARVRVEDYGPGRIRPHERTHPGPKEDRLNLTRATRANLSPIFSLFPDPADDAWRALEPHTGGEPFDETRDEDGTHNRLWRVTDADTIEAVRATLADKELLIADGHHRYETAVAFHEEEGTPESAQMLVVLVSTSDPGLEIFPTHRVFARERRLEGEREPVDDPQAALAELSSDGRPAVVEVAGDGSAIVRGDPGMLDVQLVDTLGHDDIVYTPDAGDALRRVRSGDAAVAYLMRPTRIEDVFAYARRGEVLPQKTTYFFPKLISGLLFHPL